jgi:hypothetical protein
MVLKALPNPVVAVDDDWGQQANAMHKLSWRNAEGDFRIKLERSPKNDGHWTRMTVTAINPEQTLVLALTPPVGLGDGKVVFEACLLCPMRARFEQQLWKKGLRVYSGETRARFTVAMRIACELTFRLEGEGFLPDAVFRVRALAASLNYADLVVEHTAGLDGKPAQKIGETLHHLLTQWKPSLERDLLTKANSTILKAADSKEVRLSLAQYIQGVR